jgi:hypothetical protein
MKIDLHGYLQKIKRSNLQNVRIVINKIKLKFEVKKGVRLAGRIQDGFQPKVFNKWRATP